MFISTEDLLLQSGPVWHGTALGWEKSIERQISRLPVVSERFCGVKYLDSISKVTILAYSVYLPTSGQDDDFLEVMSLLKYDISQNNTENCAIIIGTDSNVSRKSTKRRSESMKSFLDDFSLGSILQSEQPTFHHNNQTSESQIDHIFIYIPDKSSMNIKMKKHLCIKDEPSNLSSHDVIMGEISLPVHQEVSTSVDYSSSYSDFTVTKPKWNIDGQEAYQKQEY